MNTNKNAKNKNQQSQNFMPSILRGGRRLFCAVGFGGACGFSRFSTGTGWSFRHSLKRPISIIEPLLSVAYIKWVFIP